MRSICAKLWRAPVVNWNGKILGCCRNFWGDFGGNAFSDGLIEAVNNEKIQHAREMLMGRAGERDDLPCVTCDLYQKMKKDRTWLTDEELKPGLAKAPIVLSVFPETAKPKSPTWTCFCPWGIRWTRFSWCAHPRRPGLRWVRIIRRASACQNQATTRFTRYPSGWILLSGASIRPSRR